MGDDAAVLPPTQNLCSTCVSWTVDAASGQAVFALPPAYQLTEALITRATELLALQNAAPRWLLLSLTLPNADEAWLAAFSSALLAACEAGEMTLIGGDTTRGSPAIDLFCIGEADR